MLERVIGLVMDGLEGITEFGGGASNDSIDAAVASLVQCGYYQQ